MVAPVIYTSQHARHRPGHSGGQPRAEMSAAWGEVEMTGFRRPSPSERSEDQTLRTLRGTRGSDVRLRCVSEDLTGRRLGITGSMVCSGAVA